MISYYEDKMNNAHIQWNLALETDKPIAAKTHMEDYLNYKALHEARLRACGEET